MIVRLCVVDPKPRKDRYTDVLVYQLPEGSREFELFTELLDKAGIEWVTVGKDKPREK